MSQEADNLPVTRVSAMTLLIKRGREARRTVLRIVQAETVPLEVVVEVVASAAIAQVETVHLVAVAEVGVRITT